MEIVYKKQTKEFENSENCIVTEYPMKNEIMNGAVINLSGRYPDEGEIVNLRSNELVYIMKGSGFVVVENNMRSLRQGDLILIKAGEKYFWSGNNLVVFVVNNPPWRAEQHKILKGL